MLDDDEVGVDGSDDVAGLAGVVCDVSALWRSERSKSGSKVWGGVRSDDWLKMSCPSGALGDLAVVVSLLQSRQ